MDSTPKASARPSPGMSIAAAIVLGLTVAVVILCVTEAVGVASPPHSNVRFVDGAVRVYAIASGDIYDQAGLEPGDRLATINGVGFSSGRDYTAVLRSIRPGEVVTIEVLRDHERLVLEATARPNLRTSRLVATAIPVLVLLVTGAGVFFAGPRSGTTLLFLLFCASSAVNDACQLPILGGGNPKQLVLVVAYTLFSVQSPALGLNLFVFFPARSRFQRWLTLWLVPAYGIQTILGLSYLLPAVSDEWAARLAGLQLHSVLLSLFNTNVAVCSALSALSLAAVAIGRHPERVRQQARLLFFGFALLTTLQLAFYTLPLRFFDRMAVSAETYMLLDLIVPTAVAVAILRHRLWNIDLLIRQGFIYGTASAIVALTFAAAVTGLGWVAHLLWNEPDVVVLAAAAAVAALLFAPVQRRARAWVDRHLYRKPISHENLVADISEQLASVLDLQAIAMLLARRIGAALDPRSFRLISCRPSPASVEVIEPDQPATTLFSGEEAEGALSELREGRIPFAPAENRNSVFADVDLVAPIIRGNHVLGAILLGPRRSGIPYLADDHTLLTTIARETAPVMDTARLLDERSEHERLAVVGTATAAIAHELKNPLAAIKSTAAILRRRLRDDARGQELSDVVVDEVDRLEQSVLEVLTFAKPQKATPVPMDPAELIAQLIKVVQPDFEKSGITISFEAEEQPRPLLGDTGRLRQALLNLLINAREAMTTGGEVKISLHTWSTPEDPDHGIEIRVEDTGPGFPEGMLEQAFEPFVSGKRLGTGLGLANVNRTVSEHGGEVEVRNRPTGGAEIRLRLPNRPIPHPSLPTPRKEDHEHESNESPARTNSAGR